MATLPKECGVATGKRRARRGASQAETKQTLHYQAPLLPLLDASQPTSAAQADTVTPSLALPSFHCAWRGWRSHWCALPYQSPPPPLLLVGEKHGSVGLPRGVLVRCGLTGLSRHAPVRGQCRHLILRGIRDLTAEDWPSRPSTLHSVALDAASWIIACMARNNRPVLPSANPLAELPKCS